jgi:hypothetical protein
MDKLVRRVTVVHCAGDNREGTVVYEADPGQREDIQPENNAVARGLAI